MNSSLNCLNNFSWIALSGSPIIDQTLNSTSSSNNGSSSSTFKSWATWLKISSAVIGEESLGLGLGVFPPVLVPPLPLQPTVSRATNKPANAVSIGVFF